MIGPDRGDVELGEALRHVLRPDPAGDLGLVVEGEQRDDREGRDGAHGLDRDDELVEVEERLDHEQIDAAALEHRRLLRIERPVLGRIEDLELTERPDRACDEHVLSGDLARLAREADAGRVEILERVVEHDTRELAAIRSEGVRLDQLGASRDVAGMHRDDALGRPDVRLLGAAQALHGARDERAHPAVGDERRAGAESVEEAAHGQATVIPADALVRGDETGLPPGPVSSIGPPEFRAPRPLRAPRGGRA